jgi:gluconolactonase
MKRVPVIMAAVALLGGWVTVWASDNSIVAPGAKLEKLAGGFVFTTGPTSDAAGNVFFADLPNDSIYEWSVDGSLSTFLSPSGRSFGLCFDAQGNLWSSAVERGELWSIDPTGRATVVVKGYKGGALNGPRNIWVRPDGGLYFTDPFGGNPFYKQIRGFVQDREAVYYLSPDRQTLVRVIDDLTEPNGLIGTPDGKTLYIASTAVHAVYAYDIHPDGTLTDKKLFCPIVSPGMTIDDEGNVYVTTGPSGGVFVFDKTGQRIDRIDVPEHFTSNVCFGGRDRQTLFITAVSGLYAIRTRVKGVGGQ